MSQRMTILGAHRRRVKLHRRPIGAIIGRFHRPAFVSQRHDFQAFRSPGEGSQNPLSKIGLDGEQSWVRLFETEFGEVA